MLMVCDLLVYVCKIMSESRKSFDKNGGHGTTSTVKMACVDNDVLVSDQGCHISNSPETHGLSDCARCWVCLVEIERVKMHLHKVLLIEMCL